MRLVKTQRLDGWREFTQKRQSCSSSFAGVAHDVFEAALPADDHKMGDATRVAHTRNNRVAAQEIPVDEEV